MKYQEQEKQNNNSGRSFLTNLSLLAGAGALSILTSCTIEIKSQAIQDDLIKRVTTLEEAVLKELNQGAPNKEEPKGGDKKDEKDKDKEKEKGEDKKEDAKSGQDANNKESGNATSENQTQQQETTPALPAEETEASLVAVRNLQFRSQAELAFREEESHNLDHVLSHINYARLSFEEAKTALFKQFEIEEKLAFEKRLAEFKTIEAERAKEQRWYISTEIALYLFTFKWFWGMFSSNGYAPTTFPQQEQLALDEFKKEQATRVAKLKQEWQEANEFYKQKLLVIADQLRIANDELMSFADKQLVYRLQENITEIFVNRKVAQSVFNSALEKFNSSLNAALNSPEDVAQLGREAVDRLKLLQGSLVTLPLNYLRGNNQNLEQMINQIISQVIAAQGGGQGPATQEAMGVHNHNKDSQLPRADVLFTNNLVNSKQAWRNRDFAFKLNEISKDIFNLNKAKENFDEKLKDINSTFEYFSTVTHQKAKNFKEFKEKEEAKPKELGYESRFVKFISGRTAQDELSLLDKWIERDQEAVNSITTNINQTSEPISLKIETFMLLNEVVKIGKNLVSQIQKLNANKAELRDIEQRLENKRDIIRAKQESYTNPLREFALMTLGLKFLWAPFYGLFYGFWVGEGLFSGYLPTKPTPKEVQELANLEATLEPRRQELEFEINNLREEAKNDREKLVEAIREAGELFKKLEQSGVAKLAISSLNYRDALFKLRLKLFQSLDRLQEAESSYDLAEKTFNQALNLGKTTKPKYFVTPDLMDDATELRAGEAVFRQSLKAGQVMGLDLLGIGGSVTASLAKNPAKNLNLLNYDSIKANWYDVSFNREYLDFLDQRSNYIEATNEFLRGIDEFNVSFNEVILLNFQKQLDEEFQERYLDQKQQAALQIVLNQYNDRKKAILEEVSKSEEATPSDDGTKASS